MFDQAAIQMNMGNIIALERLAGVNMNAGKAHNHPYYEIYYLIDGHRVFVIEDKILKLSKNDFVIIGPDVSHVSYGENDVAFDRMLVYFTDEVFSSDLIEDKCQELANNGYSLSKANSVKATLLNFANHNFKSQNKIYQEGIRLEFNLFLISLLSHGKNIKNKQSDMMVLDIMTYIHNNYNKDISLDDIAKIVYMDKYYMCKKFKKLTSYTIYDYLNTTRITVAEKKLMETEMTITEISQYVGYNNLTSFNRTFKSRKGLSPSQFRKIHKLI